MWCYVPTVIALDIHDNQLGQAGRQDGPSGGDVTRWTASLDMSTIPDDVLHSEVARRRSAKRGDAVGGRPRTLSPCPYCREKFGTRELRTHRPICPSKPASAGSKEEKAR